MIKLILLGTTSAALGPALAYTLIRWTQPCNSGTLGYFLLPECGFPEGSIKWSNSSTFLLLAVCLVTVWLFVDSVGSAVFCITHFYFVQMYCLLGYLKVVTHMLTAKHGNVTKQLMKYRQLQILSRCHNVINQNVLIVLRIFILEVSVTICFYALISMGLQVSILRLIIFVCGGPLAAALIVMYTTFMGHIYSVSGLVNGVIKNRILVNVPVRKRSKWFGRFMRSCKPLKCHIGYTNYVDNLTPLNLLSFCFVQIANLLLVK